MRRTLVPSVLALGSAMSKSCSASAAWRRTTRPSGAGSSATAPNWRSGYAVISSPPISPGVSMRPTVRVKGRWCYLYRALDSTGATIDFVLSVWRDAGAARRLFRKALTDPSHPQPRVINTDQARLYGSAISGLKKEGILRRRCRHRPVQYLNNIVGAGPSSDQTTRESQAVVSRVSGGAANDPGLRGHTHDPKGTGEVGERFGRSATDSVSSTGCLRWRHETTLGRLDQSLSCRF